MSVLAAIGQNKPFLVAILAFTIAQGIKMILLLIKYNRFDLKKVMASGGMPSSHSAFVCAMAISVGRTAGFDSAIFAVAAVMSLIVMYDAAGVRRSAGEQAILVNLIVERIEEAGIVMDERLKEFLGHRPIEVGVGAVLGVVLAVLC